MDEELKKLGIFQVNPNLIIQVLSNFEDKYFGDVEPSIQPGFAVVKVTDKTLENKETVFMIDGPSNSPVLALSDGIDPEVIIDLSNSEDRKKMVVYLGSAEYWEECNQQREFLDVYEGTRLYQMLLQECQEIYERILKEHPEKLKGN